MAVIAEQLVQSGRIRREGQFCYFLAAFSTDPVTGVFFPWRKITLAAAVATAAIIVVCHYTIYETRIIYEYTNSYIRIRLVFSR